MEREKNRRRRCDVYVCGDGVVVVATAAVVDDGGGGGDDERGRVSVVVCTRGNRWVAKRSRPRHWYGRGESALWTNSSRRSNSNKPRGTRRCYFSAPSAIHRGTLPHRSNKSHTLFFIIRQRTSSLSLSLLETFTLFTVPRTSCVSLSF